MQQALPTTFGLKAAGWLAGLDGARLRLAEVVASLPVQYGGAVGTLAASVGLRRRAAAGARRRAGPGRHAPCPWHTVRLPIADLAGALGAAAGVVATVARRRRPAGADRGRPRSAEVGDGRGGSSAMPHKHNPVAAISARACARRAPGLVATLFAAMEQEHERGGRRLAQRVAHAHRPAGDRRLGGVLAGREPRRRCALDTARMAATVAAAARPAAGRGAGRGARAVAGRGRGARRRRATPCARPRRDRPAAGRGAAPSATGPRRRRAARRRRPTSARPAPRSTPSSPTTARLTEGNRMTAVAVSYTVDGAGRRARSSSSPTRSAPPAACGTRRCRRWPSGSGWSPTTPAGTGSRRRRPGRTRSTTWSTTSSRCSTRSAPSGRTSPGCRWAA